MRLELHSDDDCERCDGKGLLGAGWKKNKGKWGIPALYVCGCVHHKTSAPRPAQDVLHEPTGPTWTASETKKDKDDER